MSLHCEWLEYSSCIWFQSLTWVWIIIPPTAWSITYLGSHPWRNNRSEKWWPTMQHEMLAPSSRVNITKGLTLSNNRVTKCKQHSDSYLHSVVGPCKCICTPWIYTSVHTQPNYTKESNSNTHRYCSSYLQVGLYYPNEFGCILSLISEYICTGSILASTKQLGESISYCRELNYALMEQWLHT